MAGPSDDSKEELGRQMNAMETLLMMTEKYENSMTDRDTIGYHGHASGLSDYVSVVKFCGKPILPPVMTQERRAEMRQHRQQAQIAETRLRARAKQKLLSRVQLIMAEIDDKHGTSSSAAVGEGDVTNATGSPSDNTMTHLTNDDTEQGLDSLSSTSRQQAQHAAEDTTSSQHVDAVDCVNTPSPRRAGVADKHTPDSGISSKDPTRTTDNLPEDSAMLDTLADITNISSEDEDDLMIRSVASVRLLSGNKSLVKASGSEVTCSPPSKIPIPVKHEAGRLPLLDKDIIPEIHITDQTAVVDAPSLVETDATQVCQQEFPHKNHAAPAQSKRQVTHPTTVAEKLSVAFRGQAARNQSQHAVGNSTKSSSSSGTTMSSDDMNQTVIAKIGGSLPPPDVLGLSPVDGGLAGWPLPVECGPPPSSPVITGLLGKVALDSDTPEECFRHASPRRLFIQTSDITEFTEHESSHDMHNLNADDTLVAVTKPDSDQSLAALAHSMAVTDRTKSCDLSVLHTDSTELAPYMASVADSTKTSVTTLPHLLDTALDMTKDEMPASATLASQTVPRDARDGKKVEVSSGKHVRRSSYTLEHPSPALLAQATLPSEAGGDDGSFELTCSMEDLRLKPVQRRLSYTDPDGGHGTDSTRTKDEEKIQGVVQTQKVVANEEGLSEGKIREAVLGKDTAAIGRETNLDIGSETNVAVEDGENALLVEARNDILELKEDLSCGKTEEHAHGINEVVVSKKTPVTSELPGDLGVEVIRDMNRDKAHLHDEREGKQEHLERYLHTLSQMPPFGHATDAAELHDHTGTSGSQTTELDDTNISSLVAPLDIDVLASLSEDDLLNVQQVYFERLREQLVREQQQQLGKLLAEQQKQQMLFQREILAQERDLLSQHRTSGDTSRHSSKSSTADRKNVTPQEERKRRRRSNEENGHCRKHTSRDKRRVDTNGYEHSVSEAARASHVTDNSVSPTDHFGPLRTDYKPSNASVPKVSFDMSSVSDEHWRSHTPERRRRCRSELAVGCVDMSYTSPLVTLSRMSSPHRASTPQHRRSRPSPGSRGSSHRLQLSVHCQNIAPEVQRNLEKMSAAVKGYLTRRLLASEKVQQVIKTISDTAEFALNFQQESPIKKGVFSEQDKQLHARVLAQLTAAMYEIHEIFFELPVGERMAIISMSRRLKREKLFRPEVEPQRHSPGVSAATLKMMARRRKIKAAEKTHGERIRPKSAPPDSSSNILSGPVRRNYEFKKSRALRPKHATTSPIKPTKDTINRLVAKEQQMAPPKRRLHNRLPPKDHLRMNDAIGDRLLKKGPKLVMKRVIAVGGHHMGDGNSIMTTQHKATIPRVTMTTNIAAASRPKVKSVK